MVLLETECTVARLGTVGDAAVDPEEVQHTALLAASLVHIYPTGTALIDAVMAVERDQHVALTDALAAVHALIDVNCVIRAPALDAHIVIFVAARGEVCTRRAFPKTLIVKVLLILARLHASVHQSEERLLSRTLIFALSEVSDLDELGTQICADVLSTIIPVVLGVAGLPAEALLLE